MSVLYSPIPVRELEKDWVPPENWCWWRLRLTPNSDGNVLICTLMPPGVESFDDASACVIEIFDGCDARLDFGLDRDDGVAIVSEKDNYLIFETVTYLNILMGSQPTPCPRWRRLTDPGEFFHPDGLWPPEGHMLRGPASLG